MFIFAMIYLLRGDGQATRAPPLWSKGDNRAPSTHFLIRQQWGLIMKI